MGYVFALFGVPITILSILGNLLTITAVVKTRSLRTRHAFLPITSLACCDLFFSLLCCPVNYITTIMEIKTLDPTWCRINGFLGMLFCLTSILTLSILSLDRYICIVKPFKYNIYITPKRVKAVIFLKWTFAAMIASVPLSGWGDYVFYPQKGFCFIDYKKHFGAFVFIGVWIYVCFGFISFSYFKIFKAARRQKQRIRDLNHPKSREVNGPEAHIQQVNLLRRIKKENKTSITIFAIISAFLICWLPFCFVNFAAAALDFKIPESADVICTLLVAVGSCVNPLLYGWLDTSFRAAFKRILTPIFHPHTLRTVPRIRDALQPLPWAMPFYIEILRIN